ncbi:MAG: hypothetical protein A2V66_18220 [Ignavibacteria bacterium RBG_13_36_8]|nr:MAG: hypothetical protein A2V66_18220 [Ignavibacteria bacterium RBG_13_36_8]
MRKAPYIICMIILVTTACTREVVEKSEKPKIKEVIDQFYKIYETKDSELFSKIVAHDADMVTFGTDSVEHWIGYKQLKAAFEKQWTSFETPKIVMRDLNVKISQSGSIAWYSMFLDYQIEFQGKTVNWTGARSTGVLEKRNNQWVLVQFHNSMPVTKREAEY